MRDGWLDSGDLAHADDDGYLWFFGRKKQIMVHDGSNISPFEVEGALAEHPAVALVGVIGIRDEVHGENVRAYVTIADGRRAADRAGADRLRRVSGSATRRPEEIVFLDEMPLNPTGKLDRVGLKRMAEAHLNPHAVGVTTASSDRGRLRGGGGPSAGELGVAPVRPAGTAHHEREPFLPRVASGRRRAACPRARAS